MSFVRIAIVGFVMLMMVSNALGKEPTWTGPIVKRGTDRVVTQRKTIEHRPYRPFHFYGNTRRRVHYRGQVLPRPSDLRRGATAFVRER